MHNKPLTALLLACFATTLTSVVAPSLVGATECNAQCAEQNRRMNFIEENPSLSAKIRGAILNGRVLLGMSKDEVIAAIGTPVQSVDTNASWAVREQWVYQDQEGLYYYYFKFGTVTGWHKPQVR